MASTAQVSIQANYEDVSGVQQIIRLLAGNSTSFPQSFLSTLSTDGANPNIYNNISTNNRFMLIVPPSTNLYPMRLAMSSADTGFALSSQLPSLIALSMHASYPVLWTTNTTVISNVRVVFF